ncbi:MAG: hypothetical protein EPN91_00665 [Salinibacterium sp.]|nr:MAG: hypothetical protein EPN91_00665 [Salinibacterium sp.]
MYYNNRVGVHISALKHGVTAVDVLHAANNYLVAVNIDDGNPHRELRLGFDTAGRLLETVVLAFEDGRQLIIHAMKARPSYLGLLPEGWL